MTTVLSELGRGLNRAWESLAAGWRELMRGATNALTQYVPATPGALEAGGFPQVPGWGLLPGEVMETKNSIVVQIELPGINRDDIDVDLDGNALRIRGEKRIDREHIAENYYLRERAYGRFERVVPLPPNVNTRAARASYRAGVLTVELPKTGASAMRRIKVQ